MTTVNILQAVQQYTNSGLGRLQNVNPWISKSNMRYKEFSADFTANLGDTISFDLPTRYQSQRNTGLVVTAQGTNQRKQTLTLDQDATVAPAFTDQQLIENMNMGKETGKPTDLEISASNIIGNQVGADIAEVAESGPYRIYGDGLSAITTYFQLAQAIEQYQDFGSANGNMGMFVNLTSIAAIIDNGANQFTPIRNDKGVNSWELGNFNTCDFYKTNLLKIHTAGVAGSEQKEMIVTNVSADGTQVTLSGAPASETVAIAQYDILVFDADLVTNLRALNFASYTPSEQPVQVSATADASSNGGGVVVVNVYPPLIFSDTDPGANLSEPIAPLYGVLPVMIAPSYRCGLLMSGNPLFLAMPRLPTKDPYMTVWGVDEVSGAAIRTHRGSTLDTNQTLTATQCLWGKTFARDYGMIVPYPLTSVDSPGSLAARKNYQERALKRRELALKIEKAKQAEAKKAA